MSMSAFDDLAFSTESSSSEHGLCLLCLRTYPVDERNRACPSCSLPLRRLTSAQRVAVSSLFAAESLRAERASYEAESGSASSSSANEADMPAGLMDALMGVTGGGSPPLALAAASLSNASADLGDLNPVLESVLLEHLSHMEHGERPASKAAVASLPRLLLHSDAPVHSQLPQRDVLTLLPGRFRVVATVATFSAALEVEGSESSLQRMRVVAAEPASCAAPLSNATACVGAAVLCDRGVVPFASKARTAVGVGAAALIVINSDGVWPLQMSDPSGELRGATLALRAVMVSAADGVSIRAHVRKHGVGSECTLARTCDVHSCAVCMDAFTPGESAILLPCGHPFHDQCVGVWLSRANTCPVCRQALPAATDDEMLSARTHGMDDRTRERVMAMARAMTQARAQAQRDRAHALEREAMLTQWYA